ncbi:hypothetical protein [Ktedonobacter racemifer]|uniref:Uncharacterized protein n=1 Tax=Ktedonobacter racemifer DSM 44963 TaxID=485913 RepID=D6TQH5_KTERA|nr:hypothetical protein [Ktedonobacter racemifer]EFH87642.1 hypothetical protein Krac_8986 [Ktedonobacter racemifer DSM 44963]
MQPYADNIIQVIPVLDEPVHTDAQQFCSDPTCGCHDNLALIDPVNQQYLDGLLTAEEATRTLQGRQV